MYIELKIIYLIKPIVFIQKYKIPGDVKKYLDENGRFLRPFEEKLSEINTKGQFHRDLQQSNMGDKKNKKTNIKSF